jgi:hypothetical protein
VLANNYGFRSSEFSNKHPTDRTACQLSLRNTELTPGTVKLFCTKCSEDIKPHPDGCTASTAVYGSFWILLQSLRIDLYFVITENIFNILSYFLYLHIKILKDETSWFLSRKEYYLLFNNLAINRLIVTLLMYMYYIHIHTGVYM